jgi:hypothetical protein
VELFSRFKKPRRKMAYSNDVVYWKEKRMKESRLVVFTRGWEAMAF